MWKAEQFQRCNPITDFTAGQQKTNVDNTKRGRVVVARGTCLRFKTNFKGKNRLETEARNKTPKADKDTT